MLKRVEKIDKEDGMDIKVICYVDENGKGQGPFEAYCSDGCVSKGTLKDDRIFGPHEIRYANGDIKERCVCEERGRLHGPAVSYYEGNRIATRSYYEHGQQDGPQEVYDKKGILVEQLVFRDGCKLSGQEAEDYLRQWENEHKEEIDRQEAIIGLKERLAKASDLDRARADTKPASTPERTEIAARMKRVRRERDVIRAAAIKAREAGDEELLKEIAEIAKPSMARAEVVMDKYYARREARRAARAKNSRG